MRVLGAVLSERVDRARMNPAANERNFIQGNERLSSLGVGPVVEASHGSGHHRTTLRKDESEY